MRSAPIHSKPFVLVIRKLWILGFVVYAAGALLNECWAQNFEREKLEGVILYKIMQLTQWPDENDIEQYNIGIYRSNTNLKFFRKLLKDKKIRGKSLNIIDYNPYKNTQKIHTIFITKSNTHKLKEINKLLKGKNVLTISDQSTDKRHVMINFPVKNSKQIFFEVNRANITLAGIKISNDIILIGGSELDIAKIYNDTVSDLNKSKDIIVKKDQELIQHQQALQSKDQELKNLIIETDKQKKQMKQQKLEINKSNKILINSHLKLKNNITTLKQQHVENQKLQDEISANKLTLVNQTKNLAAKDKEIKLKEAEIHISKKTQSQQQSTIKTQKNYLIFFVIQVFLVATLIVVLFRSFLAKKRSNTLMNAKNIELENTMRDLQGTQKQLIESEKMASLGSMVKGIAHEINTPAGIVLTATSSLLKRTEEINKEFKEGKFTEKMFVQYLEFSQEITQMSVNNIKRLSELVKNFKLVAVDQYSNQKRIFELTKYTHDVAEALHIRFKDNKHTLNIVSGQSIIIHSYPGAFSHIISLLTENSLLHAFSANENGVMNIELSLQKDNLIFTYSDNGSGANKKTIDNIFEPFYTTLRSSSCTGLGGHILYNLVTQLLKGTIQCEISKFGGLEFKIIIPVELHDETAAL